MSGDGFRAMPDRMHGELEQRLRLGESALEYGNTFLGDYLLGILPHDLVLLGAATGLGKTDLALDIAATNAMAGNPTHYFALEAEPLELERRRKYSLLSREAHRLHLPGAGDLSYRLWHFGRAEHIVGSLNDWADRTIATELSHLHTFYRGKSFTAADLAKQIIEIHDRSTLIVVDHLHYVDADDDIDENRALGETVKIIRDVVLRIGRPVLLVAHLRKKDERAKKLIPDYNDFHGSSNITKIATQVISIERAHDIEPTKWWYSPTYVALSKDRLQGQPRVVALMNFDVRTKRYAPDYTLGKVKGMKWEPLGAGDAPGWAKHHRPLASDNVPSTQAEIPHAATRYA